MTLTITTTQVRKLTIEDLQELSEPGEESIYLVDQDLTYCDFTQIDMENVNFIDCIFTGSNFEGVVFKEAYINGGWAEECNFKGAIFEDCNIRCVNFDRSDMSHTKFKNTPIDTLELHGVDLTDSDMQGNSFLDLLAFDCVFENANLSEVTFQQATFSGSDLSGANLSNAKVWVLTIDEDCKLEDVNWSGVDKDKIFFDKFQ